MSRQILCRKCGDKWKPHPEDISMGFAYRKVWLSCVLPEGHGLRINGEFKPLADILCDLCGEPITGQVVHAVSMWRHQDHTVEMAPWESEYGTVLSTETVKAADALAGKEATK